MLNIQIDDIKEKGLLLEGEVSSDDLPQLRQLVDSGSARFPEPIRYRLNVDRLAEMVEVEGLVETSIELPCSRCLEPYRLPFSAEFELAYARDLPEVTDEEGEEMELSADELGLILLEGDEIALAGPIEEHVLMALPIQPLCDEECRGLCAHCGANLNENPCQCEEPKFDTRFSALKNFKVEE